MTRCECGSKVATGNRCPSCVLYNAAVEAQKAAASYLAKEFHPRASRAWMNEHGVFAWLNGHTMQVAGPKVSAPFERAITASRRVAFPSGTCWIEGEVRR